MPVFLPPAPPGARRLYRLPVPLPLLSLRLTCIFAAFLCFCASFLSPCVIRASLSPLFVLSDQPQAVAASRAVLTADSEIADDSVASQTQETIQSSSSSAIPENHGGAAHSQTVERSQASAPQSSPEDHAVFPEEWHVRINREPGEVGRFVPPSLFGSKAKDTNGASISARFIESQQPPQSVAGSQSENTHAAGPGPLVSQHRGGQHRQGARVVPGQPSPSLLLARGKQESFGAGAGRNYGQWETPRFEPIAQDSRESQESDVSSGVLKSQLTQTQQSLPQHVAASQLPLGRAANQGSDDFSAVQIPGGGAFSPAGQSPSDASYFMHAPSEGQPPALLVAASDSARGDSGFAGRPGASASAPASDSLRLAQVGRQGLPLSPRHDAFSPLQSSSFYDHIYPPVHADGRGEKESPERHSGGLLSNFAEGARDASKRRAPTFASAFGPGGFLEAVLSPDLASEVKATVLRKTGEMRKAYLHPGLNSLSMAIHSLFSPDRPSEGDSASLSAETRKSSKSPGSHVLSVSQARRSDRDEAQGRGESGAKHQKENRQGGVGSEIFASLGLEEEFATGMHALQKLKEVLGFEDAEPVSPPPPSPQRRKRRTPPYQVQVRKKMVTVSEWYLHSLGATMNGRREDDEDALLVHSPLAGFPHARLVGLFDGHAGYEISRFCATHASNFLGTMADFSAASFKAACLAMDDAAFHHSGPLRRSGSTGIMLVIEQNWSQAGRLFFRVHAANVGDSRAFILRRDGSFLALSIDHKPNDPDERQRIESAGGHVKRMGNGIWRLDGSLALSRAFGDFKLKQEPSLPADAQRVVAVPDVVETIAYPGDILFLACDGMFEARGMTWSGVASLLKESLDETQGDLPKVAYKLLDSAFTRGSGDNISVIIARLAELRSATTTVSRFDYDASGNLEVQPAVVNGEMVRGYRTADGVVAVHPAKEPLTVTLF
uniref:Protein phosphatase 2C, putative n=1 Tax=Neospora caninum (strain Liverpool) TaxID=572307 RepID=A0A0F7UHJ8_NEOCL|nr:TPA: protein phosphatase 2C, putative [Neospora caninum Liverpool]